MLSNPLAADLDHILTHTSGLWEDLRGQRLFITGGTGFIGCWLLASFAWANERLDLGAEALVLTRNYEAFARKAPHLARRPDIQFHSGDVRDFAFPAGRFSRVIHATNESEGDLNSRDPKLFVDTVVTGARRVLDFAAHCGARRFLLASSGAVYGRQPAALTHLDEDYNGGPDVLQKESVYGECIRMKELLGAIYARQHGFELKVGRGFTFVGPYLPLDAHFAVGNFIRDAMGGGPIKVNGDGTHYRSYLYAADLAIWFWTILFRGASNRPYNVGSRNAVSIAQLAEAVSRALPGQAEVQIAQKPVPGQPAARYIPETARAEQELGLREWVSLDEAIRRTAQWHQKREKNTREKMP
jgi:nucleoside-diphosphate-sugar epimerase